jgi:hypothetical protein
MVTWILLAVAVETQGLRFPEHYPTLTVVERHVEENAEQICKRHASTLAHFTNDRYKKFYCVSSEELRP